jgi:hypothetical protein
MPDALLPQPSRPFEDTLTQPIDMSELLAARD